MTRYTQTLTAGAAVLLAAGVVIGVPASAGVGDPDLPADRWATVEDLGLPQPNASERQQAIRVYEYHPPRVYTYDGAVTGVETQEAEGSEQVISLATDILFQPDKWDLPDSVEQRLDSLLREVPQGARIQVQGHTDSVVGAVDNQELSQERAAAVAAVIAQVRPDLEADATGYGATRLKEKESGEDEAAARRANRRVEIRYED